MKQILKLSLAFLMLISLAHLMSCKDDDPDPEVIASFTFAVDGTDFKKVTFTNASTNYSQLSWDFGDGSAVSTEVNPVHTYAAAGEFTVKLTATSTNGGQVDTYSQVVTIADPNAELTKLVGDTEKTWKLLRDVSTGKYPLEVGPISHTEIWWAMGRNNDELALRPCLLNDEFTFKRDGTFTYDAKGDYWAEGGVFEPGNICGSTTDPMVSASGEDLSAWAGGTHHFRMDLGASKKITAIGNGAFIGFLKATTDCEVHKLTPMVQDSVTYDILSLYDGTVDTLVIQVNYKLNVTDPAPGGYWRYILVHYDNPGDEPPIPGNVPSAGFTLSLNGLEMTCTYTGQFATEYTWDFGDGQSSNVANPVHTYANAGIYTVTLTATNSNGSATTSQTAFVSATVLTDAILQGGAWKVPADNNIIFVGPGLGNGSWWSCPKVNLDGTNAGTADDWSCLPDDEFTFSAGGVFTYDTKGSARNDGYMGSPNGCFDDTQIANSGNGAAFGSGSHTYEFIPASKSAKGRPMIILTNGTDRAAFIGFYKGYFGGENTDATKLPNGGNLTNQYEVMGYANTGTMEYLFVSVDITADHNGTAAWSVILERPVR